MTDTPKFEFREVLFNTPHDNLCTAISLIQSHILAGESLLNPESLFGQHRFERADLEAAVAMLVPLTGYLEKVQWEGEGSA